MLIAGFFLGVAFPLGASAVAKPKDVIAKVGDQDHHLQPDRHHDQQFRYGRHADPLPGDPREKRDTAAGARQGDQRQSAVPGCPEEGDTERPGLPARRGTLFRSHAGFSVSAKSGQGHHGDRRRGPEFLQEQYRQGNTLHAGRAEVYRSPAQGRAVQGQASGYAKELARRACRSSSMQRSWIRKEMRRAPAPTSWPESVRKRSPGANSSRS